MLPMTTTLSYENTDLEAIWVGGQWWVRGQQTVAPLGFDHYHAVQQIVRRHPNEFGDDETRMMLLPTRSGIQKLRVFSLRGVRRLGMLARTPEGAAFRSWALDVMEGRVAVPLPTTVREQPALPGILRVPAMLRTALDQIELLADDPEAVRQTCQEYRAGYRQAWVPGIERFATLMERADEKLAAAYREKRAVEKEARQAGITRDELREAMVPLRAAGMLRDAEPESEEPSEEGDDAAA